MKNFSWIFKYVAKNEVTCIKKPDLIDTVKIPETDAKLPNLVNFTGLKTHGF